MSATAVASTGSGGHDDHGDGGMTGYVLRRSALSLGLLGALLAVGGGALVAAGAPVAVPVFLAVVVVLAQYALGPYLVQWLIPAARVDWVDGRYDTDLVVGEILARRCAEAGVRPVRLGFVDDGMPNAFTFGHTRRNARVYVTRGLLERLDDRELDTVISHEVGHVRQNDVLVMAIASTIPIILYYLFLGLRSDRNANNVVPAVVGFVGYLFSQLVVLSLSRARELSADRYSCAVTGDGDALCSALVAIGYGMGQVEADTAARFAAAREARDEEWQKAVGKQIVRHQRMRSAGVLGIAAHDHGGTVLAARERGLDPHEVVGALRWDACHPWARFSQLLSSHPLVVRRIAELESSGLPGAPRRWSARSVVDSGAGPDLQRAWRRFWVELPVRFLPWAALVVGALAWRSHDGLLVAQAVTLGGVALLVRTAVARPLLHHVPEARIAALLTRFDADPVRGLPVELRGRVTGRGVPGYALSPDVVVRDESGFLPVLYRQPWPFARSAFGLLRVDELMDTDVVVRGWYRRGPTPVLELRQLVPDRGQPVRSYLWLAAYAISSGLALAGGIGWVSLA